MRKKLSALTHGFGLTLVLLAIPLAVAAGTLAVPNTFSNGTVADADDVNANFDAVETEVNDNDSRITAAQSTADTAVTNAAAAQSTADTAVTNAATAQTTADGAATSAAAAQSTADNAQVNVTGSCPAEEAIRAIATDGTVTCEALNSVDITALQAAIAALQALVGLGPRFTACADGLTVADNVTGLLWERKTTATGDVHDVTNTYTWSSTGVAADGTAYTVFLADLNTGSGFSGHTDWRLSTISELQSILVGPGVTTVANADPADPASGTNPTGQATTCSAGPCIDAAFAAIGGPIASSYSWSASSNPPPFPNVAWFANFNNGSVSLDSKTFDAFVRAVRAGSCGP